MEHLTMSSEDYRILQIQAFNFSLNFLWSNPFPLTERQLPINWKQVLKSAIETHDLLEAEAGSVNDKSLITDAEFFTDLSRQTPTHSNCREINPFPLSCST
jgi:hypothetical protein